MASSSEDPPVTNLAALLLIKRSMGSKEAKESDTKQAAPPPVIGAHSNERITYHQDAPVEKPPVPATKNNDQTKPTRQAKQLEVKQLDQKMDEINRRQEEKTNAALDSWKGFDSLNYGFNSTPETRRPTPAQPVSTRQRTPAPQPQRELTSVKPQPPRDQPTPLKPDSAGKQAPPEIRNTPPSEKEASPERFSTPPKEEEASSPPLNEDQPSPSPSPKERLLQSRPSTSASAKPKTPSAAPTTEHITPISAVTSNPQIFQRHSPPVQRSSVPMPNDFSLKRFPDIKQYDMKKSRKAGKSIQRSMDRYRFHVW